MAAFIVEPLPSPFRCLIPELLCEIFRLYLLPEVSSPGSTTSPLILSWVSPYWRSVAIHDHELWRALRIMPRSDAPRDDLKECPIAMLTDLWLARSGNKPLHIVFGHNPKGRVSVGQALLDVICSYASRWQDVDFHGCTFGPGSSLPLQVKGNNGALSALKTFRIQEISIYNRELKPHMRNLICSAPALQTLYFKGAVAPWLQDLPPTVTSLSLTDIFTSTSPRLILQILGALAPHLESLALNVSSWTPQWGIPTSDAGHSLILPKLHSLSLHTDGSAVAFFDMCNMPALREFEFYHDYAPTNAPALVSFFRRSKCPLEILTLRNSYITPSLMHECIQLTNDTLIELNLHSAKSISASELCEILSPNSQSAYASHLRRLTFTEPRVLDSIKDASSSTKERRCLTFSDVLLARTSRVAAKPGPAVGSNGDDGVPQQLSSALPLSGLRYLHACVSGSQMKQLRSIVDSFEDEVELKVGCSRRSICVCLKA